MNKVIVYTEIDGLPDEKTFAEIMNFLDLIFEKIDFKKFERRFLEAKDLLINLALDDGKVVGLKIGYQIDPAKFYSWLGGVDENYRQKGIAQELLNRQHLRLAEKGYGIVQTKTKNIFKPMLIINIKNGFDIIDVYRSRRNELKIVLEKSLTK